MNSRDLTEEQRAALVKELDRHRVYFYRLTARMRARKWFIDSATLNAVEAAWHAISAAINAIRTEGREAPKDRQAPFELPPPGNSKH